MYQTDKYLGLWFVADPVKVGLVTDAVVGVKDVPLPASDELPPTVFDPVKE